MTLSKWGRGQVLQAEAQCPARDRVIDRTDAESEAAAAGRQIVVSSRSFPAQQGEQLEGYMHIQGRHCSEVVRQ